MAFPIGLQKRIQVIFSHFKHLLKDSARIKIAQTLDLKL